MKVQSVSFTGPGGEYAAEQAEIERRRRMAEMLQQGADEPLQANRMAGGMVIPISPLEGMAKIAKGAMSGYQNAKSEQMAKALRDRQQGDTQADISAYVQALRGRPASPGGLTEDASGNVTMADPMQARPGGVSPELIAQLRTPQMQGMALQQLISQMTPKEIKAYKPGDVLYRDGVQVASIPKPAEPFTLAPGAQRFGADNKPIASVPATPPNDVREYEYAKSQGFAGTFEQFQQQQRKAGATKVTGPTVIVGKGDEKYVEKRREGQAAKFAELEKAAESAYRQIGTLDRFIQASQKGTAGGAQPVISGVQNLLSSFGYTPESLKDVRVMEQAIGDILGNKMSELGARGLTDKDMEILRQALPRVGIDKESRIAIANILKKTAEFTLGEYGNARAEEERIYPEFAQKTPVQGWFKDWKSRNNPDGPPPGAVRRRN